jgi:hypothetical protein
MIAVARSLAIKRKKFLGNAMIRLALYAGFPHSVRPLLILYFVSRRALSFGDRKVQCLAVSLNTEVIMF